MATRYADLEEIRERLARLSVMVPLEIRAGCQHYIRGYHGYFAGCADGGTKPGHLPVGGLVHDRVAKDSGMRQLSGLKGEIDLHELRLSQRTYLLSHTQEQYDKLVKSATGRANKGAKALTDDEVRMLIQHGARLEQHANAERDPFKGRALLEQASILNRHLERAALLRESTPKEKAATAKETPAPRENVVPAKATGRITATQLRQESARLNQIIDPNLALREDEKSIQRSMQRDFQATQALTNRLKGNLAWKSLVSYFGYDHIPARGEKIGDQYHTRDMFAAYALHSAWTTNNTNYDPINVALRFAAIDEFHLSVPTHAYDDEILGMAQEMYHEQGAGLRAFARAMYDESQAWFKSHGITEITVYRGYNPTTPHADMQFDGIARTRPMTNEAFQSFTSDPKIAYEYAAQSHRTNHILTGIHIPVSEVLSSPGAGLAKDTESEFLVLGKPDRPTWTLAWHEPHGPKTLDEALKELVKAQNQSRSATPRRKRATQRMTIALIKRDVQSSDEDAFTNWLHRRHKDTITKILAQVPRQAPSDQLDTLRLQFATLTRVASHCYHGYFCAGPGGMSKSGSQHIHAIGGMKHEVDLQRHSANKATYVDKHGAQAYSQRAGRLRAAANQGAKTLTTADVRHLGTERDHLVTLLAGKTGNATERAQWKSEATLIQRQLQRSLKAQQDAAKASARAPKAGGAKGAHAGGGRKGGTHGKSGHGMSSAHAAHTILETLAHVLGSFSGLATHSAHAGGGSGGSRRAAASAITRGPSASDLDAIIMRLASWPADDPVGYQALRTQAVTLYQRLSEN